MTKGLKLKKNILKHYSISKLSFLFEKKLNLSVTGKDIKPISNNFKLYKPTPIKSNHFSNVFVHYKPKPVQQSFVNFSNVFEHYKPEPVQQSVVNNSNDTLIKENCLICYNNKKLNSKFNCVHKVCEECFSEQIKICKNLSCCICRSEVNLDSLTGSEKSLLDTRVESNKICQQENITEILVSINGTTGNPENNDVEYPRYYPSWMDDCIGRSSPLLQG